MPFDRQRPQNLGACDLLDVAKLRKIIVIKSKKNKKTAPSLSKEKVEDKENENKNVCSPNPDPILPTNQHDSDENVSDPELKCGKCGSVFPSKNKLFNHLKSTGHALYLGQEKAKVKSTDQKLTKKQKRKL